MKIYFDLDGVLAGFELYYNKMYPEIDIHDREQFAINAKTFAEIEWFKKLPVLQHGMDLLMECYNRGYDIEILSAAGSFDPEIVSEHKKQWCLENIPFPIKVNVVNKWYDKDVYANSNSFLIDDRQKGVDSFIKFGGYGFLYTPTCTVDEILSVIKQSSFIKQVDVFPDYCSSGIWDSETRIMLNWDELGVDLPFEILDKLNELFWSWEDSQTINEPVAMTEEWHQNVIDVVRQLNQCQSEILFTYKREYV